MNRRTPRATLGLAAVLTLGVLTATASSLSAASDLDKISLGKHWFGPEISLKDLEGHVVLYEFWGIN